MVKLMDEMKEYRNTTLPAFLQQVGRVPHEPDSDTFMESSVRAYARVLAQSYGPDSDWYKERLAIALSNTCGPAAGTQSSSAQAPPTPVAKATTPPLYDEQFPDPNQLPLRPPGITQRPAKTEHDGS